MSSAGIATVLAVAGLVGCSRSPREEARRALESLHSWTASTRMVGERWLQRAVPDRYVGEALKFFGKRMREERSRIASGTLPADVRTYLLSGFDSTALATDSLLMAVERGERGAAARIVSGLAARARSADSVMAHIGGT
ncbi:MAG TPA: hypothetical protein VFR95_13715 [Gemmatimonadaceae bacterium]|nr:hypothetical protein [Gemmatimonadaceae bacterium]